MLGGNDDELAGHQTVLQGRLHPHALTFREPSQCWRVENPPAQLNAAVGGVDALTTGSGRAREPLDQLCGRDNEPGAEPRAGGKDEIAALYSRYLYSSRPA